MSEKSGNSAGSLFIFPGTVPNQALRTELRKAGLRLLEPVDSEEAHSVYTDVPCDLVLLESASNEELKAALETVEAAGAEAPPVLVLAESARSPEQALELIELGATDVVSPVVEPALLRAKLNALLRIKRRLDTALELSVRDELTGLYNRRFFDERLEQEVSRARRTGLGIALVLFDLDHFKKVNDTYGHPVGDALLRGVARTAELHTRKSDLVARLGGDEFVLLLSSNTVEGARVCAEGLRVHLGEAELDLPPGVRLTASFGVASWPHPLVRDPMADLVGESDKALLRAKAFGRDRVIVAGHLDDPSS